LVFRARGVRAALCGKGFQEHNDRDHRYFFFCHEGKRSHIYTKISHNESEINDYLCSAMSRQIKLTRAQFRDLIECPLTARGYSKLLIGANHLKIGDPK